MRNLLFLCLAIMLICSCSTIDSLIPPETQCALLKQGGNLGADFFMKKEEEATKTAVKITQNIILPKLSGKEAKDVSMEDLDNILKVVNKDFSNKAKKVIQAGINVAVSFAPGIEEAKVKQGSTAWERFIYNLKCVFQGFIQGVAMSNAPEVKNSAPYEVKLRFVK